MLLVLYQRPQYSVDEVVSSKNIHSITVPRLPMELREIFLGDSMKFPQTYIRVGAANTGHTGGLLTGPSRSRVFCHTDEHKKLSDGQWIFLVFSSFSSPTFLPELYIKQETKAYWVTSP